MGILKHSSNYQNCIKKTNKIPDYASEFRNEYLLIRGIDKKCENFVKMIKENEEFYNGPEALRILKCLNKFNNLREIGNFKYIFFNIFDVRNLYIIHVELDKYIDLYFDPYTGEFEEEIYNNNVESDNPGFKSFYNCFYKFYDKLVIDEDYFTKFLIKIKSISTKALELILSIKNTIKEKYLDAILMKMLYEDEYEVNGDKLINNEKKILIENVLSLILHDVKNKK